MTSAKRPFAFTVVYDPERLADFNGEVKAKDERKAVYNAVDKLRRLGSDLAPPHMKPLQRTNLFELRPRQGKSPTCPLRRRFDDTYVILAIAVKDDFDKKLAAAQARAQQYE